MLPTAKFMLQRAWTTKALSSAGSGPDMQLQGTGTLPHVPPLCLWFLLPLDCHMSVDACIFATMIVSRIPHRQA